MTNGRYREIKGILDSAEYALANSPSYSNDPNLFEAVQGLVQAIQPLNDELFDATYYSPNKDD